MSDENRLLLHAYVDGELDPANALGVERQIAADPALAAEYAQTEALRRALREKLPPKPPPPRLRAAHRVGDGRSQSRAIATKLAGACRIGRARVRGSEHRDMGSGPAGAERRDRYGRARRSRARPDGFAADRCRSSDRHTVKPWFNGRIPQAPRVVDLAQAGFPLVGGRIDVIASASACDFGLPAPPASHQLVGYPVVNLSSGGTVRREIRGFNLIGWSDGGTAYWAVSDLGADDLERFARAFRAAPAEL